MRKILKFLKYLVILLVVAGAGLFIYVQFFVKITERDIMAFVPEDFIFMVQAEEPIENWKDFSDTKIWKHLKTNKEMADIEESANYLDSLVNNNKKLFALVGKKPLILTAHMTKVNDYDFLYLMDLKGAAKLGAFMDVLQIILDKLVMPTQKEVVHDTDVYKIGEGADAIYLTIADNILLCSYTKALIEKALITRDKPVFPDHESWNAMRKKVDSDGQGRVMVNFKMLDEYLKVYMDDPGEMVKSISESLEFAMYDFEMTDGYMELDGYTSSHDSVASMINALKNTNGSTIKAPEILPERTSFFASINFDEFDDYYAELEKVMKQDKASWDDFSKTQTRLENFLNISVKEHFFSWIGEEITISMMPVDQYGRKQSYLAFLHAPDLKKAQDKLDFVVRKFKKNVLNPVKFKEYEYRDFEVNYMELKGFFKIFIGKLFSKFDKPQYITIDEWVVFSNDTTALHRVVDGHLDRKTLQDNAEFRTFFKNFSSHSNYFTYLNAKELYPWLPTLGNIESGKGIRENKRYIVCFPQVGLQFREKRPYYRSYIRADFEPQN